GALGGGVVDQLLVPTDSGDRAGIDDRGALAHVFQRGGGQVDIGEHVGAERAFDLLRGEVLGLFDGVLFTGVVDQDIQAPVGLDGATDQLAAKSRVAHVAGDARAFAALGGNQASRFRRVALFLEISDHDL